MYNNNQNIWQLLFNLFPGFYLNQWIQFKQQQQELTIPIIFAQSPITFHDLVLWNMYNIHSQRATIANIFESQI